MNIVSAALAANVQINSNLPGVNASSTGIAGFIANFYSFALIIAGILAFGAIVYGGIKYATGGGNPSAESEGKSWITSALLGLLLLAGAWIILYTVNPDITTLNIPGLPTLTPLATSTGGGGTPCGTAICQPNSQVCWVNGPTSQCVAAIMGIALCGIEGGTNNGPCLNPSQTCAVNGTGQRQCVLNTVPNACNNSNPTGTCTDPNAKCTNVSGNYACVSQIARPPQCKIYSPGSCVWLGLNPQPPNCAGYGRTWIDNTCNNPPPRPDCSEEYRC